MLDMRSKQGPGDVLNPSTVCIVTVRCSPPAPLLPPLSSSGGRRCLGPAGGGECVQGAQRGAGCLEAEEPRHTQPAVVMRRASPWPTSARAWCTHRTHITLDAGRPLCCQAAGCWPKSPASYHVDGARFCFHWLLLSSPELRCTSPGCTSPPPLHVTLSECPFNVDMRDDGH